MTHRVCVACLLFAAACGDSTTSANVPTASDGGVGESGLDGNVANDGKPPGDGSQGGAGGAAGKDGGSAGLGGGAGTSAGGSAGATGSGGGATGGSGGSSGGAGGGVGPYLLKYYGMKLIVPNYVGGYFWWYFAEQMVPKSQPLWTTLSQAMQ